MLAKRMHKATMLGITGGIGSGKSTVTRMFSALGALTLNIDRLGHEILAEPEVLKLLRDRWGEAPFQPNGEISRQAVAAIVFEPTEEGKKELDFLEQTLHPRIAKRVEAVLKEKNLLENQLVLLDAPLLIEAGWDKMVDRVVFVDCPESRRKIRFMERGWSEEEFRRRNDRQLPVEIKRARADWVIDNSGDLERTAAQVRNLWDKLNGSDR